nr:dUTP pyrophosphatase [Candidatus Cloacimonadota bacterium]
MKIAFRVLSQRAQKPKRMSAGAAGYDLFAALEEKLILRPGQRETVSTGIAISLSKGYEAQIRPRSGLAIKYGLTVLNSPGTIDSDYRGEIKVILINLGQEDVAIYNGMRIAQMVFSKIEEAEFLKTDVLEDTERNEGGFGHSGE